MRNTITILGTVHIAWGALGLLMSMIIYIVLVLGGALSGDYEAERILGMIASIVSFPIFLLNIAAIIGGIGLLKFKNWARVVILVHGFVMLLYVPFGTVLGIFAIKYMLDQNVIDIMNDQEIPRSVQTAYRSEPVTRAEE